jgi:hypothetical protein
MAFTYVHHTRVFVYFWLFHRKKKNYCFWTKLRYRFLIQKQAYRSGASFGLSGIRVARSLGFFVEFCILFLSFFIWPMYYKLSWCNQECTEFQHRCKILYTPDYTKITNLFLIKQKTKKQHQHKKTAHWEKCYFVFDFTYITLIIVYIHQILCKCIISYHTIAVCSSKLLFFIWSRV